MPIYEYRCTNCGHRTDIVHGINDPGPAYCPACGAEATMRKQFAPPAIHYKGSGWAKKDRGGAGGATKTPSTSPRTTTDADPGTAAGTSSTSSGEDAGSKSNKPARDSAASASAGGE